MSSQDATISVQVKVYASLSRQVADVSAGEPFEVAVRQGDSIGELLSKVNLQKGAVKVVYVNGRARRMDWKLVEGDEVGIFPLVGGG
jgi:molybdopterin converting factor small subunit